MPRTLHRLLVAVLAGAILAACSDVVFEGGGPLRITVTAEPASPRAGQEARLVYDAIGSILVSVVVEYGDGTADTVDTFGAQTASGYFVHTYQEPGAFTVIGTVFDNLQGPASTQLTVQVTAGQ